MRALVTGADGFVGRWLSRHLESAGDEVHQLRGQQEASGPGDAVDLRDRAALSLAVAEARPEAVYHLAAVSFGPEAAGDPDGALAVNAFGTANLLQACRGQPEPPFVLVVSSAEVYAPLADRPILESDPLLPSNVYGATKLAQEAIALAYERAGRLPVAVVRPFNHIGPGQRPQFVVPSFARQLARIQLGLQEPEVRVGNLAAIRDFSDVRDVVRAYRLIVAAGLHGRPLNVASGEGTQLGELLAALIEISGVPASVRVDPERLRSLDVPSVVGNASVLTGLTGWRPQFSLSESLQAVWQDARDRFASDGT